MKKPIRAVLVACLIAAGSIAVGMSVWPSTQLYAQDKAAPDRLTDTLGDIFRDALGGSDLSGKRSDRGDASSNRRLPASQSEMAMSFSPLVKQTAPAVVNVYADRTVVSRSPFAGDPFFEQFFGRSMPNRTEKQSALGSGVIIEKSGIIVTNNHVISGADDIRVALSDGREFESKVLLKDERFDLAVLKIGSGEEFPSIDFGDSDALEVGDLVLAIGNPFGVGQTVTSGIISAIARNGVGVSDFGFFIQTDAAINPGNSGGALIDMNGRLIGVNTAIFSRSGGSNGIGFAIPANLVRTFALTAESGSDHFEPPYIGATFEPVTAEIADALGLDKASGALVVSVVEGGPADLARLRAGDIIIGFNGQKIEHPDALGYRLATVAVGETVDLTVIGRAGVGHVKVAVVNRPADLQPASLVISGDSAFAGITAASLTPDLARRMRLPTEMNGVVVSEVDRRSPAAQYGFKPKDVITEINGVKVATPQQLQATLDEGGYFLRFELIRNGRRIHQMFNR